MGTTQDKTAKERSFAQSCHGGLDPPSPIGISRLLSSEISRQAQDDKYQNDKNKHFLHLEKSDNKMSN